MDTSDRRAILKTLLLLCAIINFLLTNMKITALAFRICNLQASKCPFSAARCSGVKADCCDFKCFTEYE